MPTVVAPEHFQTQQGFTSGRNPELTRSLEPALALPTGGLHRPTANRLTSSFILIEQGTNATVGAGMLLPPTEAVKPEYTDFAI